MRKLLLSDDDNLLNIFKKRTKCLNNSICKMCCQLHNNTQVKFNLK